MPRAAAQTAAQFTLAANSRRRVTPITQMTFPLAATPDRRRKRLF
jgi:hypothetical protein